MKGALNEVLRSLSMSLSFSSTDVSYARGAKKLRQDILRGPSYGSLIIIADPASVDDIIGKCSKIGVKTSRLGALRRGSGLTVDDVELRSRRGYR